MLNADDVLCGFLNDNLIAFFMDTSEKELKLFIKNIDILVANFGSEE